MASVDDNVSTVCPSCNRAFQAPLQEILVCPNCGQRIGVVVPCAACGKDIAGGSGALLQSGGRCLHCGQSPVPDMDPDRVLQAVQAETLGDVRAAAALGTFHGMVQAHAEKTRQQRDFLERMKAAVQGDGAMPIPDGTCCDCNAAIPTTVEDTSVRCSACGHDHVQFRCRCGEPVSIAMARDDVLCRICGAPARSVFLRSEGMVHLRGTGEKLFHASVTEGTGRMYLKGWSSGTVVDIHVDLLADDVFEQLVEQLLCDTPPEKADQMRAIAQSTIAAYGRDVLLDMIRPLVGGRASLELRISWAYPGENRDADPADPDPAGGVEASAEKAQELASTPA